MAEITKKKKIKAGEGQKKVDNSIIWELNFKSNSCSIFMLNVI